MIANLLLSREVDPSLTGTRIRQRVLAGQHAANIVHIEILNVAQEAVRLEESGTAGRSSFPRSAEVEVRYLSRWEHNCCSERAESKSGMDNEYQDAKAYQDGDSPML